MWESLVVNFGSKLSSPLREEFLSAPIHSPPLSGRLIGPSPTRIGCVVTERCLQKAGVFGVGRETMV
jgi:hypothetical protein